MAGGDGKAPAAAPEQPAADSNGADAAGSEADEEEEEEEEGEPLLHTVCMLCTAHMQQQQQ